MKKNNYFILRYSLISVILSLAVTQVEAQNNGIFKGGNSDGFASGSYTQPNLNSAIFKGGSADGFALGSYTQPNLNSAIFKGGDADGFAFGSAGAPGSEVPLPVDLISFTGKCHPDDGHLHGGDRESMVLRWSTASETNNAFFTVERSPDAENWTIIGTTKGAGNSSVIHDYSFVVSPSVAGMETALNWFYRLKQTDYNGEFEYSKIFKAGNCRDNLRELSIFPNPAKGTFNLLFNGDKEQVSFIEVYNALDERIYFSGIYQSVIDLTGMPPGIYLVHFNSGSNLLPEKLSLKGRIKTPCNRMVHIFTQTRLKATNELSDFTPYAIFWLQV